MDWTVIGLCGLVQVVATALVYWYGYWHGRNDQVQRYTNHLLDEAEKKINTDREECGGVGPPRGTMWGDD